MSDKNHRNIYVRVDGSKSIGSGHIFRCLSLAKFLRNEGCRVNFISRELPESIISKVKASGIGLYELPEPAERITFRARNYRTWLKAGEEEDARQSLAVIGQKTCDAVIVDHYGVSENWLGIFRQRGHKLVVLDDLANRPLPADIIVNQNLGWSEADYEVYCAKNTQLLIGPKYAILHPAYSDMRHNALKVPPVHKLSKILISLGGGDSGKIAERVLEILSELSVTHEFSCTLVAGLFNPYAEKLSEIAKNLDFEVKVHTHIDNLWDLYRNHDLAIGAVGGSVWERCCLGLPTLMIVVAENQAPAAEALHRNGAGVLLGDHNADWGEALRDQIARLENPAELASLRERSLKICDGEGGRRVVEEMKRHLF